VPNITALARRKGDAFNLSTLLSYLSLVGVLVSHSNPKRYIERDKLRQSRIHELFFHIKLVS
jgi:hypothetical protein